MQTPVLEAKILEKLEETLSLSIKTLTNAVETGNLHAFELNLEKITKSLYNEIAEVILTELTQSESFESVLREKAKSLRLGKLKRQTTSVQLRTGYYVELTSLYAKKAPKSYVGSRHLFHIHFGTIKGASPRYCSLLSAYSVLCCSFEVALNLLELQGIHTNLERIRTVSLAVAKHCAPNRSSLSLKKGETLANKRVVISVDGGRTRLRESKGEYNEKGTHEKFETHWREPKLFVISTLDEQGKMDKKQQAIYDATFGDDEIFGLLAQYLKNLEIDKALEVQFIADGATWIWNRAQSMLLKLGVAPHKIVETLDYFHATQHLSEMIDLLSKNDLEKHKINTHSLFKELKQLLWNGQFPDILKRLKQITNHFQDALLTHVNYFLNHRQRINYQMLNQRKLLAGSGIVESAIRRIINLRFKSASAFWLKQNVEALMFFRCVFLAKRWNNLISNLTNP